MGGYAKLARSLMNEHGLNDWKISWSRAKKTHGRCIYGIKTLEFSAVAFSHIPEDEVRETILHEIAHALAGSAAKHGIVWQRVYRSIGGTGGQYVSTVAAKAIPVAWIGKCANGHESNGQHRAPLRVKACGKCSSAWRPENIFSWYKNGRKMHISEMPDRYRQEFTRLVIKHGDRVPV